MHGTEGGVTARSSTVTSVGAPASNQRFVSVAAMPHHPLSSGRPHVPLSLAAHVGAEGVLGSRVFRVGHHSS